MSGAGDLLLEPIRAEVRRWAQPIAAARCRIELSTLGDSAGVLGAARLALDVLGTANGQGPRPANGRQ